MFSIITFGVGPLLAGLSCDLTGSYGPALAGVAAMFMVGAAVLATVRATREA